MLKACQWGGVNVLFEKQVKGKVIDINFVNDLTMIERELTESLVGLNFWPI